MRTIAYFEQDTGRLLPPIIAGLAPYGGNGLALVSAAEVDRLRTAAATLNEALCTVGNLPLALVVALRQWREAWAEVDGKPLPIGSFAPAPAPLRSARAFEGRGRR